MYYFRYLAFVASSDSCFRQELCCRNRTVFNGPYFPPVDILPTQVRVPDPKQTQHRPGPAMDEQAGPFFNNNNNNSGFPGNIKAPQTVDTGGGEAARSQYNIPGILHFLQHEWARYEVDRAHWDVERAELQRRGQENLKKDLVRRIKMLEYALKQERKERIKNVSYSQYIVNECVILRSKYHKLKYGTELNQGEIIPPSYDSARLPVLQTAAISSAGNKDASCSERHPPPSLSLSPSLCEQTHYIYLQEVGYTDTILDVKSQRVRSLLGLTGDTGDNPSENKAEHMVNGTEPSSMKDSGMAFKFIESAAAEFSDDDDEEDSEGRDKTILNMATMVRKKHSSTPSSTTSDLSDDPDTEEALKGFDFLAKKDDPSSPGDLAWDVDQGLIAQLKEQYRKERKGKKGIKISSSDFCLPPPSRPPPGPNRSKLQDMLANLRDAEDHPSMQPPVTPPPAPLFPDSTNRKCTALDVEPIYTFRAHSSAHQRLLSCSADGTVRLWNAASISPPLAVYNERGGKLIHSMVAHLDSVTCLAVDPNGLYLMSGSHDCSIRLWNMESKTCIQEFTAHRKKSEESIHDVAFHPTKCYIGSAGADALAKVFV
ncbi:hypothetical protein F7725_006009 [Dissostichus mawsoni]|uniref:Striatin N-terminal domain-containing protein n=1 Tax=Dissostichus mawsoni TaxID=36200 RepID=A0A7J5YSU8_DISMA|nr:hypothetical protein F7725_006009 [Dissostichus mawsoni]